MSIPVAPTIYFFYCSPISLQALPCPAYQCLCIRLRIHDIDQPDRYGSPYSSIQFSEGTSWYIKGKLLLKEGFASKTFACRPFALLGRDRRTAAACIDLLTLSVRKPKDA